MPSTSKKQHNLMAAVAHNPAFAKRVGIPQSVGKDFTAADKGRKFGKGGMSDATVQAINKPKTNHGASALFSKGGDMKKQMGTKKYAGGGAITTAKMGSVPTAAPSKDGMATKGKTKGTMISMKGGAPLGMKKGGKS